MTPVRSRDRGSSSPGIDGPPRLSVSAQGVAVDAGGRRARGLPLVTAITMVGGFIVSMDVSIANAVLPAIGKTFDGVSRPALSWTITGYAIAFAAALVPAGRIADRAGRRRTFLGGLVVFALGSTLCGLAWDLPALLLGRVTQGVGAAAAQPASLGLLLAAGGPSRRPEMAARWSGAGAVGIALGPVIGGALTTLISWRFAFLVNLPIVAVAWLVGPRVLPETERHPGRPLPDPLGAILLASSAALLTLGISELSGWGAADPRTLGGLTLGVAAAYAFLRRSRATPEPLLDLSLFRRRAVALVTVTTVFYSAGFFGLLFSFILFLTGAWHLTTIEAGLCIVPMAGTVVVLSLRVGALAQRHGFRIPLAAGAGLAATGLALDAAIQSGHAFNPSWIAVAILIGTGVGLCYLLLGGAAVDGLPSHELASATAVNQCARQLGAALGVASTVAVLDAAGATTVSRFHLAWALCAAYLLAAGTSALFLRAKARPFAVTQRTP
jgi:EmrB/QacA subfamily drug resistance transporter